MKRVLSFLQPYKKQAILGIIIKAFGAIVELNIPLLMTFLLDDVVPTGDFIKFIIFGELMLIFSILALWSNIKANRMAAYVSSQFAYDLRNDLFKKILSLDLSHIDYFTTPSLITRMSSDVDGVERMILIMMRMAIRAPLLFFGGLIMTLVFDPVLTLVLLFTIPLITFIVIYVSKKTIPMFKKVQIAVDGINQVLRENLSGIKVIKALSKSDYEKTRFNEYNQQLEKENYDVQKVMALTNPLMTLILNLGLVLVIYFGGFRVELGYLKSGAILAFVNYFIMIINGLMAITRIFTIINRSVACGKRIEEVYNINTDKPYKEAIINPKNHDVMVEFNNVNFRYQENLGYVLKNIDFKIKKNQTVTIIGATGAGKSTIASLLIRFYEPTSGEVYLEGVKLNDYPLDQLHAKVVIALQSATLFSTTVKDNIAYGRKASIEEIEHAAKIAQAHDFISKMENGYDSIISQLGTNLSGGQRQRIALARAVLTKPKVLILDDTSSALDYGTDARLRKALKKELKDTTFIVIAQRISSSMHSDLIIVLDQGQLVDLGNHGELMKRCQIYQEIAKSQVGGDFDAL